jgi:hypothetical protein
MIKFTLEDLGLEMFHDRWKRVKLWRMEEEHRKRERASMWAWSYERDRNILSNKRYCKAYDMRRKGYVYRVIGEALGVSATRARAMILKYERASRTIKEYRPWLSSP